MAAASARIRGSLSVFFAGRQIRTLNAKIPRFAVSVVSGELFTYDSDAEYPGWSGETEEIDAESDIRHAENSRQDTARDMSAENVKLATKIVAVVLVVVEVVDVNVGASDVRPGAREVRPGAGKAGNQKGRGLTTHGQRAR